MGLWPTFRRRKEFGKTMPCLAPPSRPSSAPHRIHIDIHIHPLTSPYLAGGGNSSMKTPGVQPGWHGRHGLGRAHPSHLLEEKSWAKTEGKQLRTSRDKSILF